jgi:hypothetical protein
MGEYFLGFDNLEHFVEYIYQVLTVCYKGSPYFSRDRT